MRARHASYRDSKRASDSGWTVIAVVVALAVAVAVGAFYWFIA
jgi:flagellar basal body-associated protein FliL